EPPQDRSGVQGVRAGAARRVRERQAHGASAAIHEGAVVIALIDYGAGNLTSVKKALAAIDADVFVPAKPGDLSRAAGVIVPGVGQFGASSALDSRWRAALHDRLAHGRPLLGICLGMQWLFEGSDEAPDCPGLGLIAGRCYRLQGAPANGAGVHAPVKVPHV